MGSLYRLDSMCHARIRNYAFDPENWLFRHNRYRLALARNSFGTLIKPVVHVDTSTALECLIAQLVVVRLVNRVERKPGTDIGC